MWFVYFVVQLNSESSASRHVRTPAAVQDFTFVQRAERGRSPSAARTTRTRPVNSQGVGATNRCEPGRFARRPILPLRRGVILERFIQGRSDGKPAAPKCAAKNFGHGCDRSAPIRNQQNGIRLIPMLGGSASWNHHSKQSQ